jgi:polyphenol oxidase
VRVRRVVTTRAGGASRGPYATFNLSPDVGDDPAAVAANRDRLARELGLESVVWMRQVHGREVAVVSEPPAADLEGIDATVTARPGTGLAVLVADCAPVLLADPVAGVLGAVHAGRVGAAAGVLPATVTAMGGLGARAERIEALIGPAICGGCYEVPAPMQAEVAAALPGSACTTRTGTPGLDLRGGLYRQLVGLAIGRIGVDPRCTFEDPDLFSYRRDGTTGRFGAVIWAERR